MSAIQGISGLPPRDDKFSVKRCTNDVASCGSDLKRKGTEAF